MGLIIGFAVGLLVAATLVVIRDWFREGGTKQQRIIDAKYFLCAIVEVVLVIGAVICMVVGFFFLIHYGFGYFFS